MKTTLITVALFASHLCSAQRILETTNGSAKFPDLSVESKGSLVYSGFTELSPTSRLAPVFKRNTPTGGPGPAFYINAPDNMLLMDFVMRQPTNTIVFAGMLSPNSGGNAPYKMVIGEWNYGTNTMVQCFVYGTPNTMIPHQVIVSETNGQVVVVGTEVVGTMTTANYPTIQKSGFMLGFNLANFGIMSINRRMDTPMTGSNDSDMLETVTEVPGMGYFAAGSGNGPLNEQNPLNMGVSPTNALVFSNMFDNTNSRAAAASVVFAPGTNIVYMLANTSVAHQFQVVQCNAFSGLPMSAFVSHQINGLPIGGGVDQNGFRLVLGATGQLLLGGYLSAPGGALPTLMTPYSMTLSTSLAFINGRRYSSGSNYALSGYFDEGGNSVYINTPDMLSYSPTASRFYVVNQDDMNNGMDLNISTAALNGCEQPLTVTTFSSNPPVVTAGAFSAVPGGMSTYGAGLMQRAVNQTILCQQLVPAAMEATVSPNPASDKVTVSIEEGSTIVSAAVYDLKGNKVAEAAGSGRTPEEITIDVSRLNAGMYVITATDENGVGHTEKFVKQ